MLLPLVLSHCLVDGFPFEEAIAVMSLKFDAVSCSASASPPTEADLEARRQAAAAVSFCNT